MNTLIGKTLQNGRYTLAEELGLGGFGVTYKATDHKLEQIVVIKTLNQSLRKDPNFENFYQQFQDEARRLATCIHPNIVRVSDFFTEDDIPYMVMDYIPGKTLQAIVLPNNPLPEDLALKYIYQVGLAVKEIHNQGLLHRDIKPNNIILREGTEEVILIDFGIAREFTPGETQNHTSIVSEGYAPIEQYLETEKRTPATDIYALSATLYVLLTAKIPTPASLRDRQKLADPIHIRPELSEKVNKAIMRGLEMEMSDRPETVDEWLELLPEINESTGINALSNENSLTALSPQSSGKPRKKINYFETGLVISTMMASFIAIAAVIGISLATSNKSKPNLATEKNKISQTNKNKLTDNNQGQNIESTNKPVIPPSVVEEKSENLDKSQAEKTEKDGKIKEQIPNKNEENSENSESNSGIKNVKKTEQEKEETPKIQKRRIRVRQQVATRNQDDNNSDTQVRKVKQREEETPVVRTRKIRVRQQVATRNQDDNNRDNQVRNPVNRKVKQRQEEKPVVRTPRIRESKISRQKPRTSEVINVATNRNREIPKQRKLNEDNQVRTRTVRVKRETQNPVANNQNIKPRVKTQVSNNNQEKSVRVNPPFSHVSKKRDTDNNVNPPHPPVQRKQDTIDSEPKSQSSGERGN